MAYFSNGSEGNAFESAFCSQCVHGQDEDKHCPVLFLHELWNYEQHGDTEIAKAKKGALSLLISWEHPTKEAPDCKMFIKAEDETGDLFENQGL